MKKLLTVLSIVVMGVITIPGFIIGFSIRLGSNAADIATTELKKQRDAKVV